MISDKKGQMEIMGLAVIVVLISLGLFLMVGLHAKPTKKAVDETYRNEQLTTSFIDVLLRTTVPSCGVSVGELMKDCATTQSYCAGNACVAVSEFLNITTQELDRAGISYNLTVRYPAHIEERNNDCGAERDKYYTPVFTVRLHPYPGDVLVSLAICK